MPQARTFAVEVQQDHLERLTRAEPINALAELIWNSFDADSTEVHVEFEESPLTGLQAIRIIDNGTGIPYDESENLFKSLGNSWKSKTKKGRFIHGEKGQGRFKAFSIGNHVTWTTCSAINGEYNKYEIAGRSGNLKQFSTTEPQREKNGKGTTVEIIEIGKDFRLRSEHGAIEKIRDIFALYLYQYPGIRLIYDGIVVDAKEATINFAEYHLVAEIEGEKQYEGELTIVEWNKKIERKLMLCLPGHFPFQEISPGIKARGFDFTAYLSAQHFQVLYNENREDLVSLDPPGEALINSAKYKLKEHFRQRETERSKNKIQEWKTDEIYPYEGEPDNPIERNERDIFNVVAVNLTDYSSDFDETSQKNQKLIFQLVKSAIETDPKILPQILEKVIALPKKKQEDLVELLRKTTLTSIINAAKAVTDRLDFLKALQILIFDPKSKKQLLERSQLHRIIAEHTWIFGEEFHLMSDDEDLSTILKRHIELLGKDRSEIAEEVPVLDSDGSKRVVDLMLSKRVPLPRGEEREHLVVEMKRPKVKINRDGISQISNYAHAVANDDRFKGANVRWQFIIVSNEIDDYAASLGKQKDRPPGLVEDIEEPLIKVWIKTWGEIIQEAEGRLKFYQERLEYAANDEEALRYLQGVSEKYISPEVIAKIEELDNTKNADEKGNDTTAKKKTSSTDQDIIVSKELGNQGNEKINKTTDTKKIDKKEL